MQPDQLIDELIATGTMNEDTLADLERWKAEHAAGKLDPEDEAYVRALHARLTNAPVSEPEPDEEPVRLDGLTIGEWRDRALKAEAELETLKDMQAGTA